MNARKTPRTDAAERRCHDEHGYHHLVDEEDYRALEIETQELAEALTIFADAAKLLDHAKGNFGIWSRCSTIPGQSLTITVQHMRDASAALARHRAKQGGAV